MRGNEQFLFSESWALVLGQNANATVQAFKCIIIFTSPYNPLHLYSMQDNPLLDAFDQFARRVSVVLNMSQTEIQAMQYDPKQRKYLPIPGTTRSNKYSATARATAAAAAGAAQPDPLTTFNDICDTLDIAA